MQTGSRVICVNDTFPEIIRAIYTALPVKGRVYTVRAMYLGREKVVKGGDSATVGVLLEGLKNPPDPFHATHQELGFSSERFADMEDAPVEQVEEVSFAAI